MLGSWVRKVTRKQLIRSWVTKFDQAKDRPEEVMLPLLNSYSATQPEMNIFKFLVKWHDYQTKELGKFLQLTTKSFQSVWFLPNCCFQVLLWMILQTNSLLSRLFTTCTTVPAHWDYMVMVAIKFHLNSLKISPSVQSVHIGFHATQIYLCSQWQ